MQTIFKNCDIEPTTRGLVFYELEPEVIVIDWAITEFGGMAAIKKGLQEWKELGFPISKIGNFLEFEACSMYKERINHFVNDKTFG